MLLADIRIPASIIIPQEVRRNARSTEIDTEHRNVPFGAGVWITCCNAWPHTDDSFSGLIFLTLSILSDHEAGDALSPQPLASVPRGRLFAVDPMTRHWLAGAGAWRSNRTKPWVGVQWEVPRGEAKATARRIVQELRGTWLNSIDRRYKGWAPIVPGAAAASTAGSGRD